MSTNPSTPRRAGFLNTLWRVLRQIFHESTGAIFLILGLFWSAAAVRQWLSDGRATAAFVLVGGFAVIFLACGWSSFRAARRVR